MDTNFIAALQQWQADPRTIRRVVIEFGALGKKDYESAKIMNLVNARIAYPKNIAELEKIAAEWDAK